mmetsp:Transcript_13699/g.34688  ORF Transcript_13699/g.34688 Transcript_13699/m.34688 type:complete len:214 (-) Transcript_13699:310-951(-)
MAIRASSAISTTRNASGKRKRKKNRSRRKTLTAMPVPTATRAARRAVLPLMRLLRRPPSGGEAAELHGLLCRVRPSLPRRAPQAHRSAELAPLLSARTPLQRCGAPRHRAPTAAWAPSLAHCHWSRRCTSEVSLGRRWQDSLCCQHLASGPRPGTMAMVALGSMAHSLGRLARSLVHKLGTIPCMRLTRTSAMQLRRLAAWMGTASLATAVAL